MKVKKHGINLGVSGVVMDGDRFLVVQRNDTKAWALPGGAVEDGETLESAVAREVKEETGLDVTTLDMTGIYIRNKWRNNILFVYKCSMIGGDIQKSAETDDFSWMQTDEETFSKIEVNTRERIKDSMNFSGDIVIRLQNHATPRQILVWKWRDIKKQVLRVRM